VLTTVHWRKVWCVRPDDDAHFSHFARLLTELHCTLHKYCFAFSDFSRSVGFLVLSSHIRRSATVRIARYKPSSGVGLSVCPSHSCIASKRLKHHHTFSRLGKIKRNTSVGRQINVGSVKFAIFGHYLAISWKRYKTGPWVLWIVKSYLPDHSCQFQWPWVTLKTGKPAVQFFSGKTWPTAIKFGMAWGLGAVF